MKKRYTVKGDKLKAENEEYGINLHLVAFQFGGVASVAMVMSSPDEPASKAVEAVLLNRPGSEILTIARMGADLFIDSEGYLLKTRRV